MYEVNPINQSPGRNCLEGISRAYNSSRLLGQSEGSEGHSSLEGLTSPTNAIRERQEILRDLVELAVETERRSRMTLEETEREWITRLGRDRMG